MQQVENVDGSSMIDYIADQVGIAIGFLKERNLIKCRDA
jgi:hypothetical protein